MTHNASVGLLAQGSWSEKTIYDPVALSFALAKAQTSCGAPDIGQLPIYSIDNAQLSDSVQAPEDLSQNLHAPCESIFTETGCIESGGRPYWHKADRCQEISAALTPEPNPNSCTSVARVR